MKKEQFLALYGGEGGLSSLSSSPSFLFFFFLALHYCLIDDSYL
jgi:hypothetical protein